MPEDQHPEMRRAGSAGHIATIVNARVCPAGTVNVPNRGPGVMRIVRFVIVEISVIELALGFWTVTSLVKVAVNATTGSTITDPDRRWFALVSPLA
jgi:hypothetical protein